MTARPGIRRTSEPLVMVEETIEFDATPGLHEWIAAEITTRDEAAASSRQEDDSCGTHLYGLGDAASVLRRCAADRKILAAHPYTTSVLPPGYGQHVADFGCETCHDWDGVTEGKGNCPTILALAEAYGLDDEEKPT